MQFRGHSLPVLQSMSVLWAFTLFHFVSQIRLCDFFRLLAIGMFYFLAVHHFGMVCWDGSKVNIQQWERVMETRAGSVTMIIYIYIYIYIYKEKKKENDRTWGNWMDPKNLDGVVAIEKGAFWSPSTMVANFTYFTMIRLWCYTVSDGEASVLEFCRMWTNLSWSLLPGPLRSGVSVPVRV